MIIDSFFYILTLILLIPTIVEVALFLKSSADLKNTQDAKKIIMKNEVHNTGDEIIKIIKSYHEFVSSLGSDFSDLKKLYECEKNNKFININNNNTLLNKIYQARKIMLENKGEL